MRSTGFASRGPRGRVATGGRSGQFPGSYGTGEARVAGEERAVQAGKEIEEINRSRAGRGNISRGSGGTGNSCSSAVFLYRRKWTSDVAT